MSYCVNCPNSNENGGKCTCSENCILKKYNLDPEYVPTFITKAEKKAVKEVKEEKAEANQVVFNPFQRGNGCTLAGYTLQEILAAYTR